MGIAVRYMPPQVTEDGRVRQLALLVRGKDEFEHVDLVDPPKEDDPSKNAMQIQSLDRLFQNAKSL